MGRRPEVGRGPKLQSGAQAVGCGRLRETAGMRGTARGPLREAAAGGLPARCFARKRGVFWKVFGVWNELALRHHEDGVEVVELAGM